MDGGAVGVLHLCRGRRRVCWIAVSVLGVMQGDSSSGRHISGVADPGPEAPGNNQRGNWESDTAVTLGIRWDDGDLRQKRDSATRSNHGTSTTMR